MDSEGHYTYAPREIQLDRSGSWVFAVSADSLNDNDWLLIYNEAAAARQEVRLTSLSAALKDPAVLMASATADKLYLAAAANVSAEGAELYRLTFNPAGPSVSLDGKVRIAATSQITAMCERPGDAALYVTGFELPEFPDDLSQDDPQYWVYFSNDSMIFTTPRWAHVPAGANWTASPPQSIPSQAMNGSDLALPLSTVFADSAAADFDGDADVDLADFGVFQGCFNGPNRPGKNANCARPDLDGDAYVDLADFGVFQSCFNGPNRPPKCGTLRRIGVTAESSVACRGTGVRRGTSQGNRDRQGVDAHQRRTSCCDRPDACGRAPLQVRCRPGDGSLAGSFKTRRPNAHTVVPRQVEGLRSLGLTVTGQDSPIASIYVGDTPTAERWAKQLFDAGIFAILVVPPGVSPGMELIRLHVTAAHSDADVVRAIEAFSTLVVCRKRPRRQTDG